MKQVVLKIRGKAEGKKVNATEIDLAYRISKMEVDYVAVCLTKTNAFLSTEDMFRISGLDVMKYSDAYTMYNNHPFVSISIAKRMFMKSKSESHHSFIEAIEEKVTELRNRYRNS